MMIDTITELTKLKTMVGAELRKRRKAQGMTLAVAAMGLGVSSVTLAKWEKGEWLPTREDNLENLFKFYDIDFFEKPSNHAVIVGREIKKNRIQTNDMSQTFLAEQIGVTRQAVSLYEQGEIVPAKAVLEKLEIFFGKKIGYFKKLVDDDMVRYYTLLLKHLRG